MTTKRIFTIIIIAIVAATLLAAGGYALFRLGYARGLVRPVGEIAEGWRHHGFGEWFSPGMGRGQLPWFGFGHGHWGFPVVGWLMGLVLGGGILALAVYGVISLVRRDRPSS